MMDYQFGYLNSCYEHIAQVPTNEVVDSMCGNLPNVLYRISDAECNKSVSASSERETDTVHPIDCIDTTSGNYVVEHSIENNPDNIIVPDQLPSVEFQEESNDNRNKIIPKIKIKALKELQEPQLYQHIQKEEMPEHSKNSDFVQCVGLQTLIATNVEQNLPLPDETCNYPSSGEEQHKFGFIPTNISEKRLKIQEKEHLLKTRLMNLMEKEKLIRVIDKNKKCLGSEIRSIEPFQSSNIVASANIIPSETLSTLTLDKQFKILEGKTYKGIEERQKAAKEDLDCYHYATMQAESVDETESVEEIDISGLKEGIIEASRTLINTQKTLKTLALTVSSDNFLKHQQTVKLMNKFKNILNSFDKNLNKINLTVENQYKYLKPRIEINLHKSMKNTVATSSCTLRQHRKTLKRNHSEMLCENREHDESYSMDKRKILTESSITSNNSRYSPNQKVAEELKPLASSHSYNQQINLINEHEHVIVPKRNISKKAKFKVVYSNGCFSKRNPRTKQL